MNKKLLALRLCLLMAVLLVPLAAAAQGVVAGRVFDSADRQPLPGVSVLVKGTQTGTITDADGNFSLTLAEPGQTLVFSFIGYATQEFTPPPPSQSREGLSIYLVSHAEELNDVVVVGYGTMSRSKMSSSVAVVAPGEVTKQISHNVASALQGRAAGVDILQQGGIAGADVTILVRGAASLTATSPLYVIDGVFSNNGLTTLNPSDIASIQVLKDGAAAAIYGSRAANGVVIITTKSGQKGDPKVNVNFSYSFQRLTNVPDFMNAEEWRRYANMVSDNSGLARAAENVSPTDPGVDTDWVDEYTQRAPIFNADASVSSGNDVGNYSFSASYMKQKGVIVKSDFEKITARANSSWKFGRLSVSENMQLSYRKRRPTASFNIGMPTLPVRDSRGRFTSWGSQYYIEAAEERRQNPFGAIYNTDQWTNWFDMIGGASVGVDIVEGLRFSTSFGGNYSGSHGYTHTPIYYTRWNDDGTPNPSYGNTRNSLSESRGVTGNITWDNVFNFERSFGLNGVALTVGHSWMREYSRSQEYTTIDDLGATNIVAVNNLDTKTTSGEENAALLSFFGRVNYDFDNRYLLSASLRRDESSKFAEAHRVGYFPAASVGWNVHEEAFMEGGPISQLKITGSYGELGANFLSPYNFDNIAFGPLPYTTGGHRFVDARAAYLKTQDLQWETSKTTDVGLDVGFMRNELTLHVSYFKKKNENLLTRIQLNPSSGQVFELNNTRETPYINSASVENKGWEFMLSWKKSFANELQLSVSANATTLSNKVLALGANVQNLTSEMMSSSFNDRPAIAMPGYAIGSFYGYKIDGIDANGDFIFSDTNNDGERTADDKVVIGNPIPKVTYGINVDVGWRDFDLTLFFNGVGGNDIFNLKKYDWYFNHNNNMVRDALNAWTRTNTNTGIPIAKTSNLTGGNSLPSEFYVEDGSYFRLKTLQIGYTLPSGLTGRAGIDRLRLYASAQNLLTITGYSGFDPEVSSSTLLERGIDRNAYPNTRTFTFGLNLSF